MSVDIKYVQCPVTTCDDVIELENFKEYARYQDFESAYLGVCYIASVDALRSAESYDIIFQYNNMIASAVDANVTNQLDAVLDNIEQRLSLAKKFVKAVKRKLQQQYSDAVQINYQGDSFGNILSALIGAKKRA